MKFPSRAASKTLALALCLAIIRPEVLLAAETRGVPLSLTPGLVLPVTPEMGSFYGLRYGEAQGLPAASVAPGLDAAPLVMPLPAQQAVLQAPQAVAAHPVLSIIDKVQQDLGSTAMSGVRGEAARMSAAAEALPAGAPARQNLLAMARSLTLAGGASAPGARLGQAYDGGGSVDSSGLPIAAGPKGWLERIARWAFLPRFVRRAASNRSGAKVPAPDHKKLLVPIERLRWSPEPSALPESTESLTVVAHEIVGQDVALKAIRNGLTMRPKGYNLFVSGPDGSGRETAVASALADIAPTRQTPPDIVAATNLADSDQPLVLEIPAGSAPRFAASVGTFGRMLSVLIPKAVSDAAEALNQDQTAFQAGVDARLTALRADVEKERFQDGKFGMTLVVMGQNGSRGMGIFFPVTYRDAKGKMQSIGGKDEEEAEKNFEALVASGLFTREEWQQATQEAAQAKLPFEERFKEMHALNTREYRKLAKKVEGATENAVAATVKALGEMVKKRIGHDTDTPAHRAWHARVEEREAALAKELAGTAIKGFRIVLQDLGIAVLPIVVRDGQDGEEPVQVGKKELAAALASGELTSDDVKTLMESRQRISKLSQAMNEANGAEHTALHEAEQAQPGQAALLQNANSYIDGIVSYSINHFQAFLPEEADPKNPLSAMKQKPDAERYRASVLATNHAGSGAPVIWERSPSYEGLFGIAEGGGRMMLVPGVGAVQTKDPAGPTLKSGSFLKANGGYLVLDAMRALKAPGVWQALMQAVDNGTAEIAEGGVRGFLGLTGDKHKVRAKVKVVLVGPPMIKMLLQQHDEEFQRNFNATAEFEHTLSTTGDEGAETLAGYLQFMKQVIVKSGGEILNASKDGIAALFEYAARLADSNEKVTAQFSQVHALMERATKVARDERGDSATSFGRADVAAALKNREEAENLFWKHYLKRMTDKVFMVDTDGFKVGQINGLAVMGDFGSPMRITIAATAGQPGLVSVDRDAHMTGQSFEKALGVVEGFLQHTFAQKKAISAHIRISFEQSYGGIDGDSATSTEIYGSLSSLSGVAINQGFAVTGSADQFGNVQAIGGVNEKIEGFFALCKERGLTGSQGIVIPKANVANLQLKPEIVKAVREGKFRIFAVDHVSQGIEILTGVPYKEILRRAELKLEDLRN